MKKLIIIAFLISGCVVAVICYNRCQTSRYDELGGDRCPKCKSTNVGRFIFGLLLRDSATEERIKMGVIIPNGCIVKSDSPKYRCNECGFTWGIYLSSADEDEPSDAAADKCNTRDGSFTIVYRQPVNGYKVKAVAKLAESDVDIISADLTFTKDGQSFTLYTECFGDTVFCKGRQDRQEENLQIFRKYKGKTVEADYHEYQEEGLTFPVYTPFFFKDMDFDGIEELVIVHYSMAVRYHDGYEVYRFVEGRPFRIYNPPYDSGEYAFIGMTDYPEIDYKKKTISCPYPEGEMTRAGCTVYGVSKTRKDTVVLNGKKHLFNHMEVIQERRFH